MYIKPYCPLKSIEFLEEFRCFNKGEKYEFRSGINFLVGDQGCGKSTMLQALMEYQNRRDEFNVVVLPTEFYFLDTEKHNPRVADNQILGHMDMRDMLMSRWKSHGESFMPRLLSFKQAKNVMFFIDEPEAALSIRSQIRVTQALKKASEYNQFVISTHSEILIRLVDQVLDLETKQWVDTEVFLKNQRNLKFKIKS